MLVLKNAVTRPYWSSMYDYACRMTLRLPVRRVSADVQAIDPGSRSKFYFMGPAGNPSAWIYLRQRKGWEAWEVSQVWTFPEHRGKGCAEKLYRAVINADGLLLASGNLHTQYSQALWRSFIRKKLFNIWAQDFRHLDQTAHVGIDELSGELDCDLNVYLKPSSQLRSRSDVRLLALKKVKA